MITDTEKKQIFESTQFFYTSTLFNDFNLKGVFDTDFKTKEDFVKILYSENTRIFFRYVITLKNKEENLLIRLA